jgi:DNA-binding XRE family transcriptional regulator
MKARKRKRLEAAGWRVGSADEFLRLKPEEAALVEMKLNLARHLRDVRTDRGLSQEAMAKLLGSSQSRVAKMEAGDRSVSVDLLVRSLLLVGASRAEIAREISRRAA